MIEKSDCLEKISSGRILARIAEAANRYSLDPRLLRARVLLHLPRGATESGYASMRWIRHEVDRIAARVSADSYSGLDLRVQSGLTQVALNSLSFERTTESVALLVCKHFHYLGRMRSSSQHWSLYNVETEELVAYCSVSPMGHDAKRTKLNIRLNVAEADLLMLSRVYTSPGAPRFAISYLLRRTLRELRKSDVRFICSAVDPNLGFTGVSYRASGWTLVHAQDPEPYKYVDDNFVTTGELLALTGTSVAAEQGHQLGPRLSASICRLKGQLIFGRPLRRGEDVTHLYN